MSGKLKKYYSLFLVILLIIILMGISGCTNTNSKTKKLNDLEYTIVTDVEIPKEVRQLIADNKKTLMKLSYTDQGEQYLVIGYGEQETSGYSVEVLEVYETKNVIYVDTNLLGPQPNEEISTVATYPYIVINIVANKKPVVFD